MLKIKTNSFYHSLFCFLLLYSGAIVAQDKIESNSKEIIIDKVSAVIGKNLILMSDVENEYSQLELSGSTPTSKCAVLEELLFNKLLVHQAEIDSVEISDKQVQAELDQRMRYYTAQVGGEDKLEEYYGKSIAELKEEFRKDVKEMLLARKVQEGITADVKVSPADVRTFYFKFNKDSLPFVNSEIEIQQIVKKPVANQEEKKKIRERIEKIRERIISGEDFATLAVLYSEDVESAKRGGELGFVGRTDLVPEFAAEAFNLKGAEVSKIVESQFGFHIIQLIKRRGEMINVRHILLSPKSSSGDIRKAQAELDSIRGLIVSGAMSFEEAAQKFSDDEETKLSGGVMINPSSGTTKFDVKELDPAVFFVIDKIKLGEVSEVSKFSTMDNKPMYKILKIKSKSEPHRINLKDDYQKLQSMALMQKQSKAVNDWINKKRKLTYIRISEEFINCNFRNTWFDKPEN